MKLVEKAQTPAAEAQDMQALRRAQAVRLPALLGATLEQTATVPGVSRAQINRLQNALRWHGSEPADST